MAVPKRRTSRARQRKRRTHINAPTVQLVSCSNCGSAIKPHHICTACGFYRDKQMVVGKTA